MNFRKYTKQKKKLMYLGIINKIYFLGKNAKMNLLILNNILSLNVLIF
jgi:hypothetical protein